MFEWVESSRLNLMQGPDRHPDREAAAALQTRFLTALLPAVARFEELTMDASPAEIGRMFGSRVLSS